MPRQARIVIPGLAHHVTQRGNNRQDVFFVDEDRLAYLEPLREQCAKHAVRVLGYCLMTNHVHLVATPATEEGLLHAVGRAHFLYTQYINRLHGRSGHLQYRGLSPIPPVQVLYNDGSLIWGGRFDIHGGWTGDHGSHRVGMDNDARKKNNTIVHESD